MYRTILSVMLAATMTLFSAMTVARAGETPVVVELFTSQGCSSCPPADAYLGQLAEREDVIALSLHVDYWDYLGWRDVFGSAGHTKRQRRYAKVIGERMIYTPQVIINGREGMVGSRQNQVAEAIARHSAQPAAAEIELSLNGDRLVADITPLLENSGGHVFLCWFKRAETVNIRAGENHGRNITYHNVVQGWSDMGEWRGMRIAMTAPKPMDADGVAVMIQPAKGGPIMAAARLWLIE
ncbi:MAG: DUF1223 domain-containing protein [Pikeienuella sp.]